MTTAVLEKSKQPAIQLVERPVTNQEVIYQTENLNLWYGETHALKNIQLAIGEKEVTGSIGPSGCGKSTYLKTLNRVVELAQGVTITGKLQYKIKDILAKTMLVEQLRTEVGMVFQKAKPFPKSIYENVAYGPRIHGIKDKLILDEIVERSLRKAFIWDEVKDCLNDNAYRLSGGQQ